MIYKFLGILLVLFFSLEINVSAQSISDIKKQKAKTEKEIAYLNSLLKEAEKEQVCFYSEIEYFKAEDSTE